MNNKGKIPWIYIIPIIVIIVAVALIAAYSTGTFGNSGNSAVGNNNLHLLSLKTEGMMSVYGANQVQSTLYALNGVRNATILYFNNTAYVTYDPSVISPQQIVSAIDRYNQTITWPYSSATVVSDISITQPPELYLETPNSALIAQIKYNLGVPAQGTETPYGIPFSLNSGGNTLLQIDNSITTLSPTQTAIFLQALNFTAPCCPPNHAYPDCCRCQIPRALSGLAKYLIVDYGYSLTQVRAQAELWALFIEQNYFINSQLTSMGYTPILPFFGCDGGCCSQPVVDGGCLLSNQFPVEYNDLLPGTPA